LIRVRLGVIWDYIEVLKPRETSLLVFIGFCAAVVAAGGLPAADRLLLALVAITLGSGGVNGLTNYIDRHVDSRMKRTRRRCLASKRIRPPENALLYCLALTAAALGLAWVLHPLCFVFGLVGTVAAVVCRKTVLCPFLGSISGCAPVLIAWFAFNPRFELPLILLCLMIWIWIPLHVWSVMLANREDYMAGGVRYFPLSREFKKAVSVLILLALPLLAASLALFFADSKLGVLYLSLAIILGVLMVGSSARLVTSTASKDAWRVYKLSAFPYLGIIFLALCIDSWLV
jgi:protoheme IX farnesyltransferase